MSVTPTYDPTLSRVRVVADGLAGAALASFERSTNQITWSTVRGGAAVAVSAGTAQLDDYEFVPGVPNYYRVTPYDAGTMTDTFTRIVSNGWGTADTGHVWTHPSSTLANFSTNGTKGRIAPSTVDIYRRCEPSFSPTATDFDIRFTVAIDKLAASDWTVAGITFRHADDDNRYFARIEFRHSPANTVYATLYRETATVVTELGSVAIGTYVVNEVFGFRVSAEGSDLKFKVWRAVDTEPGWTIEATDNAHVDGQTILMAAVGIASTTTIPTTFTFDDFSATYPPQVAGAVQTGSLTPTLDTVWLKNLARPFLNREITVVGVSDVEQDARAGVFEIVGRSLPVAVTDVRSGRRVNVEVMCSTVDDAENLRTCLAGGDPVLVHVPPDCVVPGMYAVVGNIAIQARSERAVRRFVSLPLVECAAPGPDVIGATATYQTILDTYASYTAVLSDFASYLEVLDLIAEPGEVIVE